jgi:hypothetical protein
VFQEFIIMLAVKIQLNTNQSETVLSIKSFSGNMDKFKRMRSYKQDIETGSAPLFTFSADTRRSLFSRCFLDWQMEFQINQICFDITEAGTKFTIFDKPNFYIFVIETHN